jgi:GNAT superfamily N-acetyltransferase
MNHEFYSIRQATIADVEILAHQRAELWLAMKVLAPESAHAMRTQSVPYFEAAIATNDFIGWVISEKGNPQNTVAGGGFSMKLTAPMPDQDGQTQPVGYSAHVFNVFVEPTHRKQGLARFIMETIKDYCQQNNIKIITLNASTEGRPLYESLGYRVVDNFMRLKL